MRPAVGEQAPGGARVEHVMGMPIVVDVRDDGFNRHELDPVFDWFCWVDRTFSPYARGSELSRLNRGVIGIHETCAELREVLQRCEELRLETDGYFDVRAASRSVVDPSGLVKGWSVDRAAALLDSLGVTSYAVNAGGDLVVRGGALPQLTWRVGIQHPLRRDRVAKVVEGRQFAVATSGTYERGEHVFDPHTGGQPRGVLSVTVTGPELGTADAYATAAYAMGEAGIDWTSRLPCRGYEALTILADGRVLLTPGFPSPPVAKSALFV